MLITRYYLLRIMSYILLNKFSLQATAGKVCNPIQKNAYFKLLLNKYVFGICNYLNEPFNYGLQ